MDNNKYTNYSNIIEYTTVFNNNVSNKITYTTKAHKSSDKNPSGTYEIKESSKNSIIRPLSSKELTNIFIDDSIITISNETADFMLIDN